MEAADDVKRSSNRIFDTPKKILQGRDITDLTDEEWDQLYASIPWMKAIVVYITL